MERHQGTDNDGFIAIFPVEKIQLEFDSLIVDVCRSLPATLPEILDGIYLYGSIANGTAQVGVSDLDLTLLIKQPLDALSSKQLTSVKDELQRSHSEVSKIDFDIGTVFEAMASENALKWGYWLKHHCRCIWGNDLRRCFDRFKPSREIALSVNGDFAEVLAKYADALDNVSDRVSKLRLQREASRKLVRSTNILRSSSDKSWPISLEEHVTHFLRSWPEMERSMSVFLEQALRPTDSSEGFTSALRQFIGWLSSQAVLER